MEPAKSTFVALRQMRKAARSIGAFTPAATIRHRLVHSAKQIVLTFGPCKTTQNIQNSISYACYIPLNSFSSLVMSLKTGKAIHVVLLGPLIQVIGKAKFV